MQPVLLSSMLDILLGQNIWQIFLKHPLWKVSNFATRQHSEPYSKVDWSVDHLIKTINSFTLKWLESHNVAVDISV